MRNLFLVFISLILISSCVSSKNVIFHPGFEIVGHRGNVSLYPENTLEGFISAVSLGVDAIEMDLVISADKEVVVSHEPYMAAATVITPEGKRISRSKQKNYNLYRMTYDSIRQFPTGTLKNKTFRNQQQSSNAHKPLLSEIFEAVENFRKKEGLEPITYYLEAKSRPPDYGIFQPHPREFAELIMEIVSKHQMEEVVIIKSFDANFLNLLKQKYPDIKTSYLIYETPWREGLNRLDFTPDAIGPYYKQLRTKEQVKEIQARGIKVVPWTINSKNKIKKMINLGVDGIITDYPEYIVNLRKKAGN